MAMTPLLHPYLVNDPFADPAVYVEFKFAKRALLFDLGDLHALGARKILRLSEIFVSHLHVDHFIGFDQVLRILLGRDQTIRLFGPVGVIDAVEHRLASYTWNLADRYDSDLTFLVTAMESPERAQRAVFRLQQRFRRQALDPCPLTDGVIFDDGTVRVRAAVLDHGVPCLAYAVEETAHVNVWKSKLAEMGLPVGPWLRSLKDAVLQGQADDTRILIRSKHQGADKDLSLPLGLLKEKVLQIVPGQKIAYVVDAAFTPENERRIVELARSADTLFIEACFAEEEVERAALRRHLTARQAGYLARRAGVRRMLPFHFSPRYQGDRARLEREAAEAFAGRSPSPASRQPVTPARAKAP